MDNFFLTIFFFLLNLFIFLNFTKIEKIIYISDKPSGELKKHKKPVSLLGGFIILLNFYLIFISFNFLNLENLIFNQKFTYILIILSSLFYIIGLIDDLKNLTPNLKLLLICLSFVIVAYFFPDIKLKYIRISFLDKVYYFNNFSFIFLILAFALLSNALNMFDGINLQLIIFTIFIFIIFILKGFYPIFFTLMIMCLIFLGILNFQNKVFLGDGGSYLISSIIGCSFIYQYKYFENFFYGDEVFIILLIPSIDMFRLFLVRSINGKNPFKGDLNHIHHIINNHFRNTNLTVFFTTLMFVFPSALLFFEIATYYVLIISIIVYSAVITYLKKNL